MIRVKKLALAALVALVLTAGAAAQVAGDPSQWGVAKKGSFDITEVLAVTSGDDNNGDVPVVPGLANATGSHIPAAVLS